MIVWDNFPVNDALMTSSLHLGPYQGRDPDLADIVGGVLCNPMTQAYASQVPLATAMEFLDAPDTYDRDASWSRALTAVGGDRADALTALARACADSPIAEPGTLRLAVLADALAAALAGPDWASPVAELRAELTAARDAVDAFAGSAPDGDHLAGEVGPWALAARRAADAGLAALRLVQSAHPVAAVDSSGRGRAVAPDPEPAMHAAFAVLYVWKGARTDERVVFGPRFAIYTPVVQMADGSPALERPRRGAGGRQRDRPPVPARAAGLRRLAYECRRRTVACVRRRRRARGRARRNLRRSRPRPHAPGRHGPPGSVEHARHARRPAALLRPAPRMSAPRVSVVMPAYNEAEILASSVTSVVTGLRARGEAFEVLVVENGSTDGTFALAQQLAAGMPEIRVEHRDQADYGRALRSGLLDARGEAVVNFDTDYFDLDFLDAAVGQVLADGGPAIVVGSKRGAGATDNRDPIRKLATTVFSTILRVVFSLRVSDTHGIKAMRRAAVEPYAQICTFGQDLFDTELILRVERAGLRTAEIPVEVRELRQARSTFITRVPRTLRGLWKLRWALWKESRNR